MIADSPADSMHTVVAHAPRAVDTVNLATLGPGAFDGWHDFYLLAGTAAVTLVGLLFVALSFNLDVLVHETKAHVLAHARSTLLTFSYVLVVSLSALIPGQRPRLLGVMLLTASLIVGGLHALNLRPRPIPKRRGRSTWPRSAGKRWRGVRSRSPPPADIMFC